MWTARLWSFLTVVVIAGLIAPVALATSHIGFTLYRIDATEYPKVRAYVSVVDSQGVPIDNLEQQAFKLFEDAKPITDFTVKSETNSQEPIAVALVIDVSGSMKDEGRMEAAKQAAAAFVDTMGSKDVAAVLSFSDTVKTVQGYTSDKNALKAAIAKLGPEGDTALYTAIVQAAGLQSALPQQRKVILVLSDGEDTKGGQTLDSSIAAVKDSRALLFIVGLGGGVKKDVLDKLAGSTSGRAIYVSDSAKLKQTFIQIGDELRRQYVLTYTSNLPADDKERKLNIKVEERGRAAEVNGTFVAKRTPLGLDVKGIADGVKVFGTQQIEVLVTSGTAQEIELLVGDQSKGKLNKEPYVFQWDTSKEKTGPAKVVVRAKDATGAVTEKAFGVDIIAAPAAQTKPTAPTAAPVASPTVAVAQPTPAPKTETQSGAAIDPLYIAIGAGLLALLGAIVAAIVVLRRRKPTLPKLPTEEPVKSEDLSDRTEQIILGPQPQSVKVATPSQPQVVAQAPVAPVQQTAMPQLVQQAAQQVAQQAPPAVKPVAIPQTPRMQSTLVPGDDGGQATMMADAARGVQSTLVGGGSAGPPKPRAKLLLARLGVESEILLEQIETVMGRESSNAVVIPDLMASRKHARIVIENGEFWIEDLKSKNGTRVNGEIITRRKLVNNDQIKIGDAVLTFAIEKN